MKPSLWCALALGLACAAAPVSVSAQFIIDHETSGKRLRGLHGSPAPIRRSFESDREAAATFREILAATGIPGVADRIHVRASAETANAEAQIGEDGQRYIFYNSTFMRELGARTQHYWSLVFVIAHEVGHHIAGHLDFAGQNHRVELEADRYAGFILGRMGATHEETMSAVGGIGSGAASTTHPPRDQRIQIASLGWNDGAGGQPRRTVGAAPPPASPAPFVAPSVPAPASGPRSKYAYRVGTRLEGSVITIAPQANVEACRKSCDDTVGCVGYQFGGPPPLSRTCQLFDDVKGRAIDTNWRSGLREDLARSVSVIAMPSSEPTTSGPAPAPVAGPALNVLQGLQQPSDPPSGSRGILTPGPSALMRQTPPPPAAAPAKSVEAPLRFGYKTRTNAAIVGDVIRENRVDTPLACLLMCMNAAQCTTAGYAVPTSGQGLCKIYRDVKQITSDQPGAVTAIFK